MTVKELIEKLEKCSQDKEVEYYSYCEMIYMPTSKVVEHDKIVVIEEE